MKWVGIGIQDPNDTTPANLDTSERCCELLTDSLPSGEELDLGAHTTQARERCEAGWERWVDKEERDMRELKITVNERAKNNIEQV